MSEEQKFNQAAFFDSVRASLFGGSLQQTQVDGMLILGSECKRAKLNPMVEQTAYVLATTYHETARTMQPIAEYGGPSTRYAPWYGRGYVQLTWEENYIVQENKLGKMVEAGDLPLSFRYQVHDNWNYAMEPETASVICVLGMLDGDFTGKGLNDYIRPGTVDYVNARRTVNGTDKADMIAGYAKKFEDALRLGAGGMDLPPPPPIPPPLVEVPVVLAQVAFGDEHLHIPLVRFLLEDLSDNPVFDTELDEDVREFQQGNGLTVDGIVGKGTWGELFENLT